MEFLHSFDLFYQEALHVVALQQEHRLFRLNLWQGSFLLSSVQCSPPVLVHAPPDLAVNGNDVKQLGMGQGKQVGAVLDRLLDHVLDHPEDNTREHFLP